MTNCPLEELGGFSMWTDEISFCPFCGAEATGDISTGVGWAECSKCEEGFWVEL